MTAMVGRAMRTKCEIIASLDLANIGDVININHVNVTESLRSLSCSAIDQKSISNRSLLFVHTSESRFTSSPLPLSSPITKQCRISRDLDLLIELGNNPFDKNSGLLALFWRFVRKALEFRC